MALMEMEQVKDAALKYDKPTLARLAQSGQLSPTIAVMAGMMRDRIVQSEMKPPEPATVAEEVMQPMGQRMGLGAIAPGGQPQAPQQMPQGQGLDQVPVPQQMFERQGMANGGIVAFQNGGPPPPSFSQMYAGLTPDLNALAAARKAYLGDFPTESAEERLRRRKEEQALRLMEAGLGIAGGTSEHFAANLKGAVPAIQGYAGDVAAQRKEDLARLAAERGEKGKVFEGVMGSREKAEQRKSTEEIERLRRESAEKIAETQASKASNMKQFAMDEIAAEEAVRGRSLTEAEAAKIRSSANKEYVRLTAALDPRTMSARASESRAETAAAEIAAAPTRTAMQEVNDAINKRGTPQYDRYLAAKRKDKAALKEGKTTNFAEQEYKKLLEEAEARFPGGRGAATRSAAPAGTTPPPPANFVVQ
jgi:hypothetical protein